MQKISPCLWFDGNAEEAVNFYRAIFPDAKIGRVLHWDEGGRYPKGTVLMIEFTLCGQSFQALNGGPEFKFSEAISLSVDCQDQAEVDRYWDLLLQDGGQPVACGWLRDKFGLSWQVVPRRLVDLLHDPDPAKAHRVMQAMMKMVKLDVATLELAARG